MSTPVTSVVLNVDNLFHDKARIELRGFAIKVLNVAVGVHEEVVATMEVNHRDDGQPLTLTFTWQQTPRTSWSAKDQAAFVREQLIMALTHELDECLFVNGERVFDPHRRDG